MIRSQFVTRKQKFRCPLLCSLLVASYLCKVNLKFVILPRRRPRVFYWKRVISRNENGPGRIYTAVRSSKAAKTTTGEVIKQEKVVKEGSCGVLPHLYADGKQPKRPPYSSARAIICDSDTTSKRKTSSEEEACPVGCSRNTI